MPKTITHNAFRAIQLALIIGLLSTAGVPLANAHPPKDISIAYDLAAQTLSVTIAHKTRFTSRHYIDSVTITKNGTVLSTAEYTDQPKEKPFTYTYPVAAAAGDVLEIKASCKIFGSKKATITVE